MCSPDGFSLKDILTFFIFRTLKNVDRVLYLRGRQGMVRKRSVFDLFWFSNPSFDLGYDQAKANRTPVKRLLRKNGRTGNTLIRQYSILVIMNIQRRVRCWFQRNFISASSGCYSHLMEHQDHHSLLQENRTINGVVGITITLKNPAHDIFGDDKKRRKRDSSL